MGKELSEFSDVEFEDYHPGCMWGIVHVLNFKKMLPHRKYQKGRHIRCCAKPKTISIDRLQDEEDIGLLDSEANSFQVEQQIETNKTIEHSLEMGKEKPEKEGKHLVLGYSAQRTDSIHGWMNPIILIHKKADTFSTRRRNSVSQKEKRSDQEKENSMNQKLKGNQVKEYDDVLEIFKVKKELFLDILQDPDVGISKHFPEKHGSNRIRKLKKSGSFPIADSLYSRSLTPSKLEHKQKEIWSFSKAERNQNDAQVSNSVAFRSEDEGVVIKSNHQRWDQLVTNRFKHMKHRIKIALKEKMRRSHSKTAKRLSVDEIETSRSSRKTSESQVDAIDPDHRTDRLRVMRRTASLNESLDRYAHLFHHSSAKEPSLEHSRSLRLNNEEKVSSRERVPKFFRRISSLSELESFYSILNEISRENENVESQEAAAGEIKSQENVSEENDDFPSGLSEIEESDDISEDITTRDSPQRSKEFTEQSSDSFSESSSLNHPIPEDSETNPQDHARDEKDTTIIAQDHCGELSFSEVHATENNRNVGYQTKETSNYSLHSIPDKKGDICFNYVKAVLELSGFMDNEFQEACYSPDQPLNPSLFKELETYFEQDSRICNRGFLFDSVNEALLQISDISAIPVYFPHGFSFSSRVFRSSKRDHILREVWTKVSRVMEFTPDPDQSLDDIISRDLEKDSWMNLQLQAECVALDIEDLILDELLDEVICF